jgi:hypothetical protein
VEAALEIAERTGDGDLLATALEMLTWLVLEQEGHGDAVALAARLLDSSDALPDPYEAHESRVSAAMCLAWGGRFDAGRDVAERAMQEGLELGRHRALHAAAALAVCITPSGDFDRLLALTEGVVAMAEEEGDRLCGTGAVGVAGRALALHETGDTSACVRALAVFDGFTYAAPSIHSCVAAELLRPIIPGERLDALLGTRAQQRGVGVRVQALRVELARAAVSGSEAGVGALVDEARRLATAAGAPALALIADWAAAVAPARHAHQAEALAAIDALAASGERHTANVLRADLERVALG